MRVMPWEGSGRYSPGPGMVKLLEKWFYQELRPLMAICSLNPPGNLAIVSPLPWKSITAVSSHVTARFRRTPSSRPDLWPQLFSDVNCIALWISSEKILTRLYSVLHWFHKRLEANVKNPRENRCFQTVMVFSFGSFYNSNKCAVLWKIAARLITVSTSVNKEMWVKLSVKTGDQVKAGQKIAKVGHLVGITVPSDMLHLELYNKKPFRPTNGQRCLQIKEKGRRNALLSPHRLDRPDS